MRFDGVKRVVEAYRWLWRAQRRWKPAALWWSAVEFVARVLADMMLLVVPSMVGGGDMRPRTPRFSSIVFGAGVAACLLGVAVLRVRNQPSDVPPAEWRHEEGGFGVAFPAPWESASDADVIAGLPIGAPVPGSVYRRPTSGMLVPRFVTAQTYFLGETASMQGAAESLIHWVAGPVLTLDRGELAGPGVRIASYRFENGDDDLTQAAIVFRSRNALGYMIGVTGRREDEAIVRAEARRIAEAIHHDNPVPTDGEVIMARVFDVSMDAWEATRSMTLRQVERRDSARWAFTTLELNEAASPEECRAGAIFLAGLGQPQQPLREPISYYETLLTCPSSRVAMHFSMANFEPILRQFDEQGALLYEARLERGVTPRERSYWMMNGARVEVTANGNVVRTQLR